MLSFEDPKNVAGAAGILGLLWAYRAQIMKLIMSMIGTKGTTDLVPSTLEHEDFDPEFEHEACRWNTLKEWHDEAESDKVRAAIRVLINSVLDETHESEAQ